MNFDFEVISKALEMLLDAFLPVLAGFAAAWLRAKYLEAYNSLDQQKRYELDMAVRVAVYAAEQMQIGGFITDRLDYAERLVQAQIEKMGLSIDVHQRRAMIEAAVKEADFPSLVE